MVCDRNVQLMPTLFLTRTKIWQQENGKFGDFSDPTPVWWRPSQKRLRISTNVLYRQKLESLTYIFAADSIGLCLFVFTQLSLKFEPSESKTASTKTEFYMIYSHSRSFKVIHFAINHRPTRGSISPYNIAGLISEVSEEVATQIMCGCVWQLLLNQHDDDEKLQSSTNPFSFKASTKRNPRERAHAPYIFRN